MRDEPDPRHPLAERGRRRERAQPAGRPAHEQDAALVEVIEQRAQIGPERGQAGAGREVAVPCPRAVDGEEPHACLPRDGVGRTAEAGVGRSVQVDDRRTGGIADVVVGQEAPVGQAQRARTHKRSVRAPGYPAQHSQLSTAGGAECSPFRPRRSATWPSSGTAEPGRRRSPRRSCTEPGPSTASGGSRTAARSATTTPRSSAGGSRSRSPSRRSSGRATRSTWSTRLATPTSSATCAPRCAPSTWRCSW